LYNDSLTPDLQALTELYEAACSVIEQMISLDRAVDLAMYCTSYIYRMMMLAAFTVLKLKKSSFSRCLNMESVKSSYFSAMALAKKVSIENNDIPAKSTQVLKQLWMSNKVFMQDNEIEGSLKLRIRSRLAMSLALDCLWWWKEEFGQSREYQMQKEASAEKSQSQS